MNKKLSPGITERDLRLISRWLWFRDDRRQGFSVDDSRFEQANCVEQCAGITPHEKPVRTPKKVTAVSYGTAWPVWVITPLG